MNTYSYTPKYVCSREIRFGLEDGKVHDLRFVGGCDGNLKAIGKLLEGHDAAEAIRLHWRLRSKKSRVPDAAHEPFSASDPACRSVPGGSAAPASPGSCLCRFLAPCDRLVLNAEQSPRFDIYFML